MATFMIQASYEPTALAALIKKPQDRVEAIRPAIEKMGGKLLGGWFSFGDYDIVLIAEVPGNIEMAAMAMATASAGAVRSIKTTTLLTMAEGMSAMKKAGKSSYKPPKG